MTKFKKILLSIWLYESQLRVLIRIGYLVGNKIPYIGRPMSMLLDRLLFILYGIDLACFSVNVHYLSIAHPGGILLGGNGIRCSGKLAIMSGVKFVAKEPDDETYLALHAIQEVFKIGDNVVIGANTVIMGPVEICKDVIIGTQSLVNKNITEPGVYVGCPVRKVEGSVSAAWFK